MSVKYLALSLLHLARQRSEMTLEYLFAHTDVFKIFKIDFLNLPFRKPLFCVCNTKEKNPSQNGWWCVNLIFWVAKISDNRRIWDDFQNFPELCYQFSHRSTDTTCSLTSCRAVEGKIRIPLIQSSAEPQFLVFPAGDSPIHEHSLVLRAAITAGQGLAQPRQGCTSWLLL